MNSDQSIPADLIEETAAFGVSPSAIVPIDIVNNCYIASTGTGLPEAGYSFLYHDNRNHFYFYAGRQWDGNVYDVLVNDVSSGRFKGGVPDLSTLQADLPTIRRNVEKFFQERRFFPSEQTRPPQEVFRKLFFELPTYLRQRLERTYPRR